MNPISVLLNRLPRGTDPVVPAEPPPLSSDDLVSLVREIDPRDSGWSRRLLPGLDRALTARLKDLGESPLGATPWHESQLFSGERSDVLSGRTAGRQDLNPAERTLITAAWATAASELLHERRAELGGALCTQRLVDGRLTTEPLPGYEPPDIAIVDRANAWLMDAPAGRNVATVAAELGAARSTANFRPIGEAVQFIPAPLAVVTDRRPMQLARHGHRTLGLQGPWGCLGKSSRSAFAPPLELLAGSTAVLAPAEQAKLAAAIMTRADEHLEALPEGTFQWLGREMTRTYIDSWRAPEWGFDRLPEGIREDLVTVDLESTPESEVTLAWAVGIALHRTLSAHCPGWGRVAETGSGESLGPCVLVPQGDVAVLTAVRFRGSEPESRADFAARFEEQAERERQGRGPLGDALRKALRQAAPTRLRARLFQTMIGAGPLPGPLDWTGGVARVDFVARTDPHSWPLYSAATPPLGPSGGPFRGGVSVGVQRHSDGTGSLSLHLAADFGQRAWHEALTAELLALFDA